MQPHPRVQEQHPVGRRRLDTGPASLEAARLLTGQDLQRESVRDCGLRDARAAVGRTVVDDDQLHREVTSPRRLCERIDGRGQMLRLVVHRNDNAERPAHRRCARPRTKPAT